MANDNKFEKRYKLIRFSMFCGKITLEDARLWLRHHDQERIDQLAKERLKKFSSGANRDIPPILEEHE